MGRRKITVGDWFRGAGASLRNGTAMNPLATQGLVNAAHDERMGQMREELMGTGSVGGDRNWTPPVHGTTASGRPVTVSFGRGTREGQTLICDGHVGFDEFYRKSKSGKKHDHYLIDGRPAGGQDRGNFS
jgi:hypothetical protein